MHFVHVLFAAKHFWRVKSPTSYFFRWLCGSKINSRRYAVFSIVCNNVCWRLLAHPQGKPITLNLVTSIHFQRLHMINLMQRLHKLDTKILNWTNLASLVYFLEAKCLDCYTAIVYNATTLEVKERWEHITTWMYRKNREVRTNRRYKDKSKERWWFTCSLEIGCRHQTTGFCFCLMHSWYGKLLTWCAHADCDGYWVEQHCSNPLHGLHFIHALLRQTTPSHLS